MRFNPPPGWPIEPGWSPPPEWEPDPAWPSAPPGWQFWVEGVPEADEHHCEDSDARPSCKARESKHRTSIAIIGAAAAAVVLATAVSLFAFARPEPSSKGQVSPHAGTAAPSNGAQAPTPGPTRQVIPDWPTPGSDFANLSTWIAFGGIDTQYSNNGRSVILDTHDTTDTWRTKWSGLIQPGPPMCSMHLTGRVRDITHAVGTPGGFAVGLATIDSGDPTDTTLSGSAIQLDFGQSGYRAAMYPSDGDRGLTLGVLDHEWHDIEVVVTADMLTLSVDHRLVSRTTMATACGQPVIRVWAGAAEFSDFQLH